MWWLGDALDVYSKKANIRQLMREKLIRSPKAFTDYYKATTLQSDWCPWIPGSSFMTDGFQIKLPLIALRNNRTPGLDCLDQRGFTGFKEEEPAKEINVNNLKNGVYVSSKQDLYINEEDLENHIFIGLDPGRKRPVSACTV